MQWWQQHHHKHKRLPPGSMGWSYLGETLKLYTQNPNLFFSNRQKWYGDIFKTHILGCPCVMISSPKAARTVLVTQAHLFKPTYPPSKEKLIGPEAVFFQQGAYHSMLKKLVQASFLPSTIRNSVSDVEQIVLKLLPTWANRTINTLQEMKRYAFQVAAISAFGETNELEMEEIREMYSCLEKGYNSYPLHLPGTSYWKAMKVPPRPNTYLPFGNGVHSCPGSDLAKLEILVLLHHLTISYSHIVMQMGKVMTGSFIDRVKDT
ncbi:hypothetical protein TanjilG_22469 [Lupinus angustifolius]|uniref:Uncharacterized protein n=1 Tax=Lupinus angustifolius TaxID=3871 RepID=A0A4P1RS80_LUPAN|nr:hypothetical protein TanjilG_22469 [Lupinus angustifolius]